MHIAKYTHVGVAALALIALALLKIACTSPDNRPSASSDVLYGKKWAVIGDSFSVGDFTGESTPKFTSGQYAGETKVYPFIIGDRTGMYVLNLAKSGMTLSDGDNSVMNIYRSIPEDTDYVTIYIGIKDSHQNKPLGDDDSYDTSTFTGAYNTLLRWLVENRPYAHIGIIVSPSSFEDNWHLYSDATRATARRFGVPVLDICAGDDVPYFIRQTEKDGVSGEVRAMRDEQYRVSPTNYHPNEHAHQLQSSFIEDFIRRI